MTLSDKMTLFSDHRQNIIAKKSSGPEEILRVPKIFFGSQRGSSGPEDFGDLGHEIFWRATLSDIYFCHFSANRFPNFCGVSLGKVKGPAGSAMVELV
mgnify:CR=1 FL=1